MVDGWPTQFFESLMCIYQSRPPPPDSAYVLVCNYMMQDTEYGQPTEEDQPCWKKSAGIKTPNKQGSYKWNN